MNRKATRRFRTIRVDYSDYNDARYYNRFIVYTGDLEAGTDTSTKFWFRVDGSYAIYTDDDMTYYNSTGEGTR